MKINANLESRPIVDHPVRAVHVHVCGMRTTFRAHQNCTEFVPHSYIIHPRTPKSTRGSLPMHWYEWSTPKRILIKFAGEEAWPSLKIPKVDQEYQTYTSTLPVRS